MVRWALSLAFLPAGVLAGQFIVPMVFHDHGPYLHISLHHTGWASLLIGAAALACLGIVCAIVRSGGHSLPQVRTLAPLLVGGHVATDWLAAPMNPFALLTEPAVWGGVLVELLLSVVVVVVLWAGRRLVEHLRRPSSRLTLRPSADVLSGSTRDCLPRPVFLTARTVRGPPSHAPMSVR